MYLIKHYYKYLLYGVFLCLLLFPVLWLLVFVWAIIFMVRKRHKTYLTKIICTTIIIYCIIKCIFILLLYIYYFHPPFNTLKTALTPLNPYIAYFAPFESDIFYAIVRKRTKTAFSQVQTYNSKGLTEKEIIELKKQNNFDDPFDDDLKYIPKDDLNLVYSIGPDKVDNKAGIIYDPTNGIVSTGDIFPTNY